MEGIIGILAKIIIAFVAVEHLYILWFEMFAWETVGKRSFKNLPSELFKPTKPLAANQGLYNGFLAAGLFWSLVIADAQWQQNIAYFFLFCVAIAGVYGTFTASKKIFMIQALPALIAIVLVWIS